MKWRRVGVGEELRATGPRDLLRTLFLERKTGCSRSTNGSLFRKIASSQPLRLERRDEQKTSRLCRGLSIVREEQGRNPLGLLGKVENF